MKYAAVGLMCLVTGVTLGAGAPKSAQKWKYSSFFIALESPGYSEGFDYNNPDVAQMVRQLDGKEVVSAAIHSNGLGWMILAREPAK